MKKIKRKFVSVYFEDGLVKNRKKRDLTVSFNQRDPIYKKCKNLGSTKIKEIVGIDSYKELLEKARAENRTLSNFIKYKLKEKLFNE